MEVATAESTQAKLQALAMNITEADAATQAQAVLQCDTYEAIELPPRPDAYCDPLEDGTGPCHSFRTPACHWSLLQARGRRNLLLDV